MKSFLLIFLFFYPLVWTTAQDSIHVETPKIITTLKVGHSINFDSKSMKFIGVIEDSRCPTGTDCIWAGEVKALIAFYEDGVLFEKKEFVFGVDAINPNNKKELFVADHKTIYACNIHPYPSLENTIKHSDYSLELIVK